MDADDRAVALARARVHAVHRAHMRRQAGAADVAAAEAHLSAALDQLNNNKHSDTTE